MSDVKVEDRSMQWADEELEQPMPEPELVTPEPEPEPAPAPVNESEPADPSVAEKTKAEKAEIHMKFQIPRPTMEGLPEWVRVPEGFRFPRNKQVIFIRLRSEWTDAPGKGAPIIINGQPLLRPGGGVQLWRQCVIWPLNVADKRLALKRSLGDSERGVEEMCRQMIRVTDGVPCDWSRASEHDIFWNDIGEKCRSLIQRMFYQLHSLGSEATVDFLLNCVEVRSANY